MINIDKIIQIESSGNPFALSKKGAIGLMQITQPCLDDYNHFHFLKLTMEMMKVPNLNIEVGTWYLEERIPELLKFYHIPDNEMTRIIAYNFGIGNIVDWYQSLPIETRNYLKKYSDFPVSGEIK